MSGKKKLMCSIWGSHPTFPNLDPYLKTLCITPTDEGQKEDQSGTQLGMTLWISSLTFLFHEKVKKNF
jgi:hypothetical protein